MGLTAASARFTPEQLADALGQHPPTAQQAAAIAAADEPTLLVAGAGSGKTETVAARVVYLVANARVLPGQVLGLTFTNKAAAELRTRIRRRLDQLIAAGLVDPDRAPLLEMSDPTIATYHSFAAGVIDEFGPLVGIESTRTVLTQTSAWQLARSVVTDWDGDLDSDLAPDSITDTLLDITHSLADHLITVDELVDYLGRLEDRLRSAPKLRGDPTTLHSALRPFVRNLAKRRAIAPLVAAYDAAKRDAGVVDFADQMQLAARIVTRSVRVRQILRDRHRIVLLDEYQDTGHAQRIILRSIFADRDAPGHSVTAVGDPVQSIYQWRGASAANLPRFATDYPQTDGNGATTLPLLTSFRNAHRILQVANIVSAPVRIAPVTVGELTAHADAPRGWIDWGVWETVDDENEWLAERIARIRRTDPDEPPTMAVLVRRHSSSAGIAAALRRRHIPVEVVGLGGLIFEPEVADVIAMLRVVLDHDSGPAVMRLLTGARWRMGVADIAALHRRAQHLQPRRGTDVPADDGDDTISLMRGAMADQVAAEDIDTAGLVDAVVDPGPAETYSTAGFDRIHRFRQQIQRLRSRLALPLPDLIGQVQHTIGIDIEALLTPQGRAHLDAFEREAAQFAEGGGGPVEFLDYLTAAADKEHGLTAGTAAVDPHRVQVLTVHGAKGLEWDVVAVPHLTRGVFPDSGSGGWASNHAEPPPALRGDREDRPPFRLPDGEDADQKSLADALARYDEQIKELARVEERRLFYVAVTRARTGLLLSAHHWNTGVTPRGPGELLDELITAGVLDEPVHLAAPPSSGASNPMLAAPIEGPWPIEPLGARATSVRGAAADVTDRLRPSASRPQQPGITPPTDAPEEVAAWYRDAALLLEQRERAGRTGGPVPVALPSRLSVSSLVQLASDPDEFAARLARPVPPRPSPEARRGTAFHSWVERFYGSEALIDVADLPGASDTGAAPDQDLPMLMAAFRRSRWAQRTPRAVEVGFVTPIAGIMVPGRIDAVFDDDDGGVTVVDWKTGTPPRGSSARSTAVQLAAYRLAWARMTDTPLDRVRAAFHYVRSDHTVAPVDLLDETGLEQLVHRAAVDEDGTGDHTGDVR